MGTRTRRIVAAGTLALSAIIFGAAIAQAIRQHSLDPVWMVGWLPAVLVAVYPSMTGRGGPAHRRCLPGSGARQAPEGGGQVLAMPVLIGTSGWQYRDWRGVLYPPGLAERDWLEYYAGRYGTVENNGTFYRLPATDTFAGWRAKVPDGFVMTVKASRYLTHVRRLRDPAEPVARLCVRRRALVTGSARYCSSCPRTCAPTLPRWTPAWASSLGSPAQGPPAARFPQPHPAPGAPVARFAATTPPGSGASGGRVRVAVEFRHESWVDRGNPAASCQSQRRPVLGGPAGPAVGAAVAHGGLGLSAVPRGRGPALAAVRHPGFAQLGPAGRGGMAGQRGRLRLLQQRSACGRAVRRGRLRLGRPPGGPPRNARPGTGSLSSPAKSHSPLQRPPPLRRTGRRGGQSRERAGTHTLIEEG